MKVQILVDCQNLLTLLENFTLLSDLIEFGDFQHRPCNPICAKAHWPSIGSPSPAVRKEEDLVIAVS